MRVPVCLSVVVLSLSALAAEHVHAQSFEASEFTVFSGHANSDDHLDILLVPKTKIVIIAADIAIPIVLPPVVPAFAILSNSDGTYYIDDSPSSSLIESSAWQEGTHQFVFGDVLGDGESEILIYATGAGSVSFLVSLSGPGGSLVLLQNLSASVIAPDLGVSGTTVELRDANGDGRMDLYIRVDGRLVYVVLANAEGMFVFPEDDQGSVSLAWNTFRFALDDGDVPSAMMQVFPDVHYKYEPALLALGPNVQTLSSTWSDIKEIRTHAGFAEYTVFVDVNGTQRMHIITFRKDGDAWKLAEF